MIETVLTKLEWLAKYGFIDIIFGVGVTGLAWRLIRRVIPNNLDGIDVNLSQGGAVTILGQRVEQSLTIEIGNSSGKNCYIGRAYFSATQRRWWTLWLKRSSTRLRVYPKSKRITAKKAFELKFPGQNMQFLSEYETIIRPGHTNVQSTFLALEEPVSQDIIEARCCGVLYLEYATSDTQGVHRLRV